MQRAWWAWMLVAWVSALVGSETTGRSAVPMAVDEVTGHVSVAVGVGGLAPQAWMVDTGSSRSAVTETLAARLALPIVARTEVVSASGTEVRAVVRLPQVAVGRAIAANLMAMVLPDDRLPGVHGFLGQDFLGRFHYTLDYRQGRLDWDGRGQREAGSLPLIPSEGRFLVDLPQGEGRALRLVPDSGATTLVLFRKEGRLATSAVPTSGPPVELRGVVGSRAADLVRLRELRVGDLLLRDPRAVVLDVMDDYAWPDGLLPLHLFDRVTFNGPAGYLIVD